MPLPNDVRQFISFGVFIFAIFIVALLVYLGYFFFKEYNKYYGDGASGTGGRLGDYDANGVPILESKLRRFAVFNDIYMARVKFVPISGINGSFLDKYSLIVKYDLNNLPISLETYKQDLLAEQKRIREQKEFEARNRVSPFDQVVKILDNFESADSGNKTKYGDNIDWKDDSTLKKIANQTDSLFGLNSGANGGVGVNGGVGMNGEVGMNVPQVSQDDINQLFAFIDRLRLDMNLQNVIDVEVNKRLVSLNLPMTVIESTEDFVLLRFDPADLKDIDTDVLRSFDLKVFDNKAVLSPVGVSSVDKQFTILFSSKY